MINNLALGTVMKTLMVLVHTIGLLAVTQVVARALPKEASNEAGIDRAMRGWRKMCRGRGATKKVPMRRGEAGRSPGEHHAAGCMPNSSGLSRRSAKV